MSRYCFYIDGFNVYHALNDAIFSEQKISHKPNYKYRKYKWLNYRKLALNVVGPSDTIAEIYYFTAYARWRPYSYRRHKEYIKALRSENIKIIPGRFMKKYISCHNCETNFLTHEEKGTDVNIALQILQDAISDTYDRAIIITSDSDILPAIEAVHRNAPDKEMGVMFPIGRRCYHLEQGADFKRKMTEKLLQNSLFPAQLLVGTSTITKPNSWP